MPYVTPDPKDHLTQPQMEMPLDVMGNSLVYWVQELLQRKMMGSGGRIYAMTSAGDHSVIPNYGAVSAVKAVLQSHIRQLAFELMPQGITANAIQAGVTVTPGSSKIPGIEKLPSLPGFEIPVDA